MQCFAIVQKVLYIYKFVYMLEVGSRMKVKVVKWCRKKWNEHNLMYIMWNVTKNINKTAQTAKFTDFPLILCGVGPKGTKTMQTQTLFSQIGKFFWGIQGNSGSKNYRNKNHHIFRKPWTSAFRWHTLDTSEKYSNLRKKAFAFA